VQICSVHSYQNIWHTVCQRTDMSCHKWNFLTSQGPYSNLDPLCNSMFFFNMDVEFMVVYPNVLNFCKQFCPGGYATDD